MQFNLEGNHTLYLLEGSETYLRAQWLQALKKKYLGDDLADLNFAQYDSSQTSLSKILEQARDYPCFAAWRFCYVPDVDQFDKKEQASLETYLTSPVDSTVMVFTAESLDRRLGFSKKILQLCKLIDCKPLALPVLKSWLTTQIKATGKQSEPGLIDQMIEMLGANMWALQMALEQLVLYQHTDATLSLEKFQHFWLSLKDENVFEFVEAIADKNWALVQERMQRIFTLGESPIKILALLQRHFNILLYLRYQGETGLIKMFPMPYQAVEKYKRQAQKLKGKLSWEIVNTLHRMDISLKSKPNPEFNFKLGMGQLANQLSGSMA